MIAVLKSKKSKSMLKSSKNKSGITTNLKIKGTKVTIKLESFIDFLLKKYPGIKIDLRP